MTKKDFSHFKYYAKRLKEMGFRDVWCNDARYPRMDFDKFIDEYASCFISLMDYSAYNEYDFPRIRLVFFHDVCDRADRGIVSNYKIGFDKDFQEITKPFYARLGQNINEYPTWRSAFNQLVKDYHELEKNAHKRIHKGVSIHET